MDNIIYFLEEVFGWLRRGFATLVFTTPLIIAVILSEAVFENELAMILFTFFLTGMFALALWKINELTKGLVGKFFEKLYGEEPPQIGF